MQVTPDDKSRPHWNGECQLMKTECPGGKPRSPTRPQAARLIVSQYSGKVHIELPLGEAFLDWIANLVLLYPPLISFPYHFKKGIQPVTIAITE